MALCSPWLRPCVGEIYKINNICPSVQEGQISGYNFLSHHQLLELVSPGGKAIVWMLAGEEEGGLINWDFSWFTQSKHRKQSFALKFTNALSAESLNNAEGKEAAY